MTQWLDFKELRAKLDFARVLQHYGVELKVRGEQHHGFCPLPTHNGKKNSPSFSANLKRKIWQCFGCGQHGNILDFAVLMERGDPKNGEDVRRVATILSERSGHGDATDSIDAESNDEAETGEDAIINAPLDFELKGLDAEHPYLFGRGFTAKTIERFGLGYCSRGLLATRVAIPLHNGDGKLVGYAGRVVDEKAISEENPKYRFPGRRKRKGQAHDFRKSLLIYNEHRIKRHVADLVVVEGFPSTWWLNQSEIEEVVATMGSSCSEEQGKLIVALVNPDGRVWILTDRDAAGDRCANDIFEHVAKHRFVKRLLFEGVVQPTEIDATRLQNFWKEKRE